MNIEQPQIADDVRRALGEIFNACRLIPASELGARLGVNMQAKSRFSLLTWKLIAGIGDAGAREQLKGRAFSVRSICCDKYGKIPESLSFSPFRYVDLYSETWRTSWLRNYLAGTTFVFFLYRGTGEARYLNRIRFWKMDPELLDDAGQRAWKQMHDAVAEGRIVKYIDANGRRRTYFPSTTGNPCIHVRPHALNGGDTSPLPVPDRLTGLTAYPKHAFWLNKSFLQKILLRDEA